MPDSLGLRDRLVQLDARFGGDPNWRAYRHRRMPSAVPRRSERSGVALPTFRQARRAHRMDESARAVLHARCPHVEVDCPIEAALTVTLYRREVARAWAAALLVWLVPLVIFVFAPTATVPSGSSDDQNLAGTAAFFSLMTTLAVAFFVAPSYLEMARGSAQVAALGPDIDPWAEAGL